MPTRDRRSAQHHSAPTKLAASKPNLRLVDDEPYVRGVVRGMLRRMGHVIREANDGEQVLNSIFKSRPRMNPAQLVLAEGERLDILDELGRRGVLEQVPVLVSTGSLTPARVIREKGARGVLRKPFRMQALRWAVEIVARGGSLTRRPRPPRGRQNRRM